MSPVEFLAGSGLIAWGWLAWRAFQLARGLPSRLSWAMWGHRKPRQRYRWYS
jgi:hypothetical protein